VTYHSRIYDVYVVLGNPAVTRPWVASAWARISDALDPLVAAARDRAAVRTTQYGPKARTAYHTVIRFGRIGWSGRGAAKWIHSVDGRLASGAAARFLGAEVWAPSWSVCDRDNLAPDVCFAVRNETNVGGSPAPGSTPPLGPTCILATAADCRSR